MPERRYKLLLVSAHPVQYSSPVYRRMAQHPQLEIHVAYCSLQGAESAHDPDFGVEFAVSCKTCNHAVFKFSGFPIVIPDPSHYDELRPGQTLWRPPHHLKCVNCGNVAKAFDARIRKEIATNAALVQASGIPISSQ